MTRGDKTNHCWLCGHWGSGLEETVWLRLDGTVIERKNPKFHCTDEDACNNRTALNVFKARVGLA